MPSLRTHYQNLQVTENASAEVIRGAYRYLSQKWHPDKNPGQREKCDRILKIINEAYEVLSDPVRRRKHDDWIASQRSIDSDSHIENPSSRPREKASLNDITSESLRLNDRRFSYEIASGPFGLIKRRLDVDESRVSYGEKTIPCKSVRWLMLGALTQSINRIKSGTYYNIQISDDCSTISIYLSDGTFGRKGRLLFEEIYDAIMRCVGLAVLNNMIQTIVDVNNVAIGEARFCKDGIIMPRHGLIFTDGNELVPWVDTDIRSGNGSICLVSKSNQKVYANCVLWTTKNGCLIMPLYNFLLCGGNYSRC